MLLLKLSSIKNYGNVTTYSIHLRKKNIYKIYKTQPVFHLLWSQQE